MQCIRAVILVGVAVVMVSCGKTDKAGLDGASPIAYVGATIIDGSGTPPIKDGVLLVAGERIVAVGEREKVSIPTQASVVDVSGKTIMPGMINGHGHVGHAKGLEKDYSLQNVLDNLSIYAHYGITTVVSLGEDGPEAEPVRAVYDSVSPERARFFIAGKIITGTTVPEALKVVHENDAMGVDFMKIRIDDNLGTSQKIPDSIYVPVIKDAHQLGYKIATHMYYLEDARRLLEAGTDLLAHSVRDTLVDDAFISLLKEKGVGYCPTLTRELSTFVYADTAAFLFDPYFMDQYDTIMTKPLLDPAFQAQIRGSRSATIYREQLPVAMRNLKILSDAGIPIVMGTDSGIIPTRFVGYFEHLEMSMMVDAGLTPMEAIVAATRNPAEALGLRDLGTLSVGHYADFLILKENPIDNIEFLRTIEAIYIGGQIFQKRL